MRAKAIIFFVKYWTRFCSGTQSSTCIFLGIHGRNWILVYYPLLNLWQFCEMNWEKRNEMCVCEEGMKRKTPFFGNELFAQTGRKLLDQISCSLGCQSIILASLDNLAVGNSLKGGIFDNLRGLFIWVQWSPSVV